MNHKATAALLSGRGCDTKRGVNPKNFFAELKRRNVYKVAIAYAVVAWLLIQVTTQVFPFFEIQTGANILDRQRRL